MLTEILKPAGVKFGEALRGWDLALFLVVEAADHYRAVFGLPELGHAFTDRVVLLADRRDGKPLATNEGPLHLIVPDEKRQARTRGRDFPGNLNNNDVCYGVNLRSEISVGILLTKVQDQVTSANKPLKSPPSWPQLGSCSWMELLTTLSKLFLRIELWCLWQFK